VLSSASTFVSYFVSGIEIPLQETGPSTITSDIKGGGYPYKASKGEHFREV
jgi:hypothetical protein